MVTVMKRREKMGFGVYVHVPFCQRKCPYCDFYSKCGSQVDIDAYTARVIEDINKYCPPGADSMYFGGGTPSLLSADNVRDMISAASPLENAEITMECNPNSVTERSLSEYRNAGANRISFGVQSLNDRELRTLGRLHSADEAVKAINAAKSVGFDNISADLMLEVPYQTKETLSETLEMLTSLPITHVSAYMLKIEEGTPFDINGMRDIAPDDDASAEMYLRTVEFLESRGFAQYEISNFSKKGMESRHNLHYWRCDEYYGFGPSAHSFVNGKRYAIPRDTKSFMSNKTDSLYEITESEPPDSFEKGMLKLRLSEGITLDGIPEDKRDAFLRKYAVYEKNGLMHRNGDAYAMTAKGFLVSNSIIVSLL